MYLFLSRYKLLTYLSNEIETIGIRVVPKLWIIFDGFTRIYIFQILSIKKSLSVSLLGKVSAKKESFLNCKITFIDRF